MADSGLNIIREDWAQTSSRARPNGRIGFIDGISWTFNGTFQKTTSKLFIDWLPSMTDPFNISDLMLYPIKFAENGLEDTLRARGEMFWKCRWRNYVSYSEDSNNGIQRTVSILPMRAEIPLISVTVGFKIYDRLCHVQANASI